MTAEQWKKAENMLSTVLGFVKMKVDGYDITICYAREKPTKYLLAVYVNGEIRGEWLTTDCEICRKFYYCGEKQYFSAKEKKKYLQISPNENRQGLKRKIGTDCIINIIRRISVRSVL